MRGFVLWSGFNFMSQDNCNACYYNEKKCGQRYHTDFEILFCRGPFLLFLEFLGNARLVLGNKSAPLTIQYEGML